jgi:hypothetical protein
VKINRSGVVAATSTTANGGVRLRHALALVLGVIVSATLAPSTSAYHFHGQTWPGGVVPYFNEARDQAWAVDEAVKAWNDSGAHVRFVPVPRAQAKLVIEDPANRIYCTEGRASVGYVRNATVTIFPAHGLTHACNRYWAAVVTTHELGHVLGLQHEDRYCAAMNSSGNARGGHECAPQLLWTWRCRLLEADDVAGVAAIYGGTPRVPRAQPLCPLYDGMKAPTHVRAEHDAAAGTVAISFARPAEPSIPAFAVPSPWRSRASYVILGPGRTCPSLDPLSEAVFHVTHWRWHAKPGQVETFVTPARRGRSCYGIWALDGLGRPGGEAKLFVTVR